MPPVNKIGLKQLQQAPSFSPQNSLVVETPEGTFLLPGRYFVLNKSNTSFGSTLDSMSSLYLYEYSTANVAPTALSAASTSTIFTAVTGLSTTIDGQLKNVFYKSGTLSIARGNNTSNTNSIQVSAGMVLNNYDINLSFATVPVLTASDINTEIVLVAFPILTGSTPNYTLRAGISNYALSAVQINYSVKKPI